MTPAERRQSAGAAGTAFCDYHDALIAAGATPAAAIEAAFAKLQIAADNEPGDFEFNGHRYFEQRIPAMLELTARQQWLHALMTAAPAYRVDATASGIVPGGQIGRERHKSESGEDGIPKTAAASSHSHLTTFERRRQPNELPYGCGCDRCGCYSTTLSAWECHCDAFCHARTPVLAEAEPKALESIDATGARAVLGWPALFDSMRCACGAWLPPSLHRREDRCQRCRKAANKRQSRQAVTKRPI
jgi:hypothetical protein